MSTNNSHLIAAVAGGVGLAFVGYCIYFDQKRRNDPEFKRKLIESNKCGLIIGQ
jgi:import receptor subunit TOM20